MVAKKERWRLTEQTQRGTREGWKEGLMYSEPNPLMLTLTHLSAHLPQWRAG